MTARAVKQGKGAPRNFFAGKKILVSGGSGFLGQSVLRQLVLGGARPKDIFVPRSDQFDLRFQMTCAKIVTGQDIVIHLAANAGGIWWNWKHPGALFYDNIAMGVLLMEEARRAGIEKFVQIGTVCSYPFRPPRYPCPEDDLWEGYRERTNTPDGIAKKALLLMGEASPAGPSAPPLPRGRSPWPRRSTTSPPRSTSGRGRRSRSTTSWR